MLISLVRRGADQIIGMYPLLFLVVGLTVLFFRLEDRNAWLLALMFGGFIRKSPLPTSLITASVPLRHFLYRVQRSVQEPLAGTVLLFLRGFSHALANRSQAALVEVGIAGRSEFAWVGEESCKATCCSAVCHWSVRPTARLGLIRLVTAYGTVVLGLISLFLGMFLAPAM